MESPERDKFYFVRLVANETALWKHQQTSFRLKCYFHAPLTTKLIYENFYAFLLRFMTLKATTRQVLQATQSITICKGYPQAREPRLS